MQEGGVFKGTLPPALGIVAVASCSTPTLGCGGEQLAAYPDLMVR